MEKTIITIGVVAGLLQILGYYLYISKSLREELDPNPLTWLMFAYGTFLLTFLEWDRSTNWPLLILPVACTTLAIYVAFLCWRNGKIRRPEHKGDLAAFIADLVLTLLYVSAGLGLLLGFITDETKNMATLAFLIGSNATTLTAFIPILRSTRNDPHLEHSTPWAVWTSAYFTLGVATYLEAGLWSELMIYPIMGAVLHGMVALLSRKSRKAKKS